MSDHNWKKAAPEVPEEFHMKFEETLKQIENNKIIHYKKKSRKMMIRILATAAILCSLAVTTIVAGELFQWNDVLKKRLNPSKEQQEFLADQGYTENIMFPMCLSVTILALILSVIAWVFYKGYKVRPSGIKVSRADEPFTMQQILSLLGMLALCIMILVFKFETGLAALSVAAVLIILKVSDESAAIKSMPWGTILLVTGVGVLMNLVIECGGIDLLSSFLASIMTPTTASALSGITAGVLSWFSSTLGVVIPTLVPTTSNIIQSVGGDVTVLEIVAAIGFASSSAGLSPASTAGALTMGAVSSDPEFSKLYKSDKLFIELFAWAAVSIAIIAAIALTGYFRWFSVL